MISTYTKENHVKGAMNNFTNNGENGTAVPINLKQMFGPTRGSSRSPQSEKYHRNRGSVSSIGSNDLFINHANGSHSRQNSNSSVSSLYKSSGGSSSLHDRKRSESHKAGKKLFSDDLSLQSPTENEISSHFANGNSTSKSLGRTWARPDTGASYNQFIGSISSTLRSGTTEDMKRRWKQQQMMKIQPRSPNYNNLRSKRAMEDNAERSFEDASNNTSHNLSQTSFSGSTILTPSNRSLLNNENTSQLPERSLENDSKVIPEIEAKEAISSVDPSSDIANTVSKTKPEDWVDEPETKSAESGIRESAIKIPKKRKASKQQVTATSMSTTLTETTPGRQFFLLDPMAPGILSAYLQTIFNLGLLSIFVYFFYLIVSTVRYDIDQKVEEYSTDILAEMSKCSHEYVRNNCMPGKRVPALETMCNNWERCMNQDPAVVGRAKVSAETFAEILNGFIEPISLKSMAFLAVLSVGAFFVNNVAFGFNARRYMKTLEETERTRAVSPPAQQPDWNYGENRIQVVYARTPSRHFSGLRKFSKRKPSGSSTAT